MVAVREDGAAMAKRSVSRTRHSNRKPLHPPREGQLVRGLDDQVQVIGLNRKVHDPKVALLARRDRIAHRLEEQTIAAEAWKPFARPQRDVDRMTGNMSFASVMGYADLAGRSLATSPGSCTAMCKDLPKRKAKLENAIAHLELGRSLTNASDIEAASLVGTCTLGY
jgi:hypothetical protein